MGKLLSSRFVMIACCNLKKQMNGYMERRVKSGMDCLALPPHHLPERQCSATTDNDVTPQCHKIFSNLIENSI